ncbi:HNH endonuclease [Endozoicomonas numazuensis]|uniref:HNH endonuclease n=1 Tax=Endozoicomonas numazuensis TaxID=1137799 RepID=A0A081NGI6_9GAMM|nr:HNH endonuclease [Endozoicomonas numazuensis]KEQ17559.1 HNH endonuclease [Endozoicomonas numazuensis]
MYQEIVSGELKIVDKTTFGSYYESSEWQKTRSRILVRDGRKCQACNEKAECVHHLIYDRIGKENDLDLISLCNSCHNEVHTYQNSMGPSYRLTPNEIKSLVFKRIQRT